MSGILDKYNEIDYEAIKNNILEKYIGAIENLLNKISMEKL
ncbi:hypothetical protein [Clostridium massiliodielmoense]|nr:hypothetical protein [Clostridium massiliodielmoense]EDS77672.1 hypothetical protein CBC_0234 [Clostridium botulinum C str. Eklund]